VCDVMWYGRWIRNLSKLLTFSTHSRVERAANRVMVKFFLGSQNGASFAVGASLWYYGSCNLVRVAARSNNRCSYRSKLRTSPIRGPSASDAYHDPW
jgi:hypothetical protein